MFAPFSSKRGDLEFIEVIMVLVVVVVLLVIGIVVYYNISAGSIDEAGKRITETQASVLVSVIDSMPEVQCSVRGSPKDCVDVFKLNAFNHTASVNKPVYSDILGFKVVRFEQVYPIPKVLGNGDCRVGSNFRFPPDCGNWTVYSNPKANYLTKDLVRTPVSLFNPADKTYAVGVLFVEVYS